ncbi:hypothetical protein KI387_001689 [Taxus chinensis]|uniref:CobW/HypB/UreG nucleotide-binding domain-containing protein n=1 Tax=Taxus chinensis TaxID=29808 RepID=A0AA38GUZ0_TAXCH|nr:hypothetical protein KI387_001689 [Taxus chinensis]
MVNYVLKEEHGKKIAVILNEFGEEVGVERAMITEGDALVEEWVELPNGCICCTVKSSFVQALEQLITQRHRAFKMQVRLYVGGDDRPCKSWSGGIPALAG